jgi:serine/threonine protein kinase
VFGYRQDVLLEGITDVLQGLVLRHKEEWEGEGNLNFFDAYSCKPHQSIQKSLVQRKDISLWDTSLCADWLLNFPWANKYLKNSPTAKAVVDLKDIRNTTQHYARKDNITQCSFEDNCRKFSQACEALGVNKDKIGEVLAKATSFVITVEKCWPYETISVLGSGSFGVVLEAKDDFDDQIYAVKVVPYREADSQNRDNEKIKVQREARNLARINHSNVVSYKQSKEFSLEIQTLKSLMLWKADDGKINDSTRGLFSRCFAQAKDKSPDQRIEGIFIKMELCGETLMHWLDEDFRASEKASHETRISISKQIAEGINFIHDLGIVHRDIRPDNILFTKSSIKKGPFQHPVKLGDFGLSNQIEGYSPQTMTKNGGYNALYRAPEMNLLKIWERCRPFRPRSHTL